MYNVQYIYNVQCIMYNAYCTLYAILYAYTICILYTVHYTIYICTLHVRCTVNNVQSTLYAYVHCMYDVQ